MIFRIVWVAFTVLWFTLGLSACHEGPAERAGKQLDRSAERVGDAIQQTGDHARNR